MINFIKQLIFFIKHDKLAITLTSNGYPVATTVLVGSREDIAQLQHIIEVGVINMEQESA